MRVTKTQLLIQKNAISNIFYFANLAYIVHPTRGKVLFELYDFQKMVLYNFLKHRFNIVLKPRQMGLTELIALFTLWMAMYTSHYNIQIISLKERVAKKLLKRIKHIYDNLPYIVKVPIINGVKGRGTATELVFKNNSVITSIPTTEDAGRSEAVSLLIIDEAAIIRNADTIWAAAFPTLSTGGRAIINITGDTEIMTNQGPVRVDSIAPKEFGVDSISHLGLQAVTHMGELKDIIYSVNKGVLETWEIETGEGKILKCTPQHKLLTLQGWWPVEDIILEGIPIITYDVESIEVDPTPNTTSEVPEYEEWVTIIGFPKYMISNLGRVMVKSTGLIKKPLIGKMGYHRVSLHRNNASKKFTLSRLVAEHFIGPIPEGFIVDHIDNNRDHNYVTNLQIISNSSNAQRAQKYSRGIKLGTRNKGVDFTLVAYIRNWVKDNGAYPGYSLDLELDIELDLGLRVNRSYITRVLQGKIVQYINTTYIKVNRVFKDMIYDITVADNESYIDSNNFISHNTPLGMGNWYHQTWVDGLSGSNGFNNIKLDWRMHPDRQDDWYDDTVFDLVDIKDIEEFIADNPPIETRYDGKLLIFERPKPGKQYFLGSDVSTGRAKDYSTFTILDKAGNEMAAFKGRVPTNRLAYIIAEVGKEYNWALAGVEANDVGEAVVMVLQELEYPNIYHTIRFVKEKGQTQPKQERVPGWFTTSKTRPVILNSLEEDVREVSIVLKNPHFVVEAYTFIYDEANRPVAMSKGDYIGNGDATYTDDSIICTAIANHIRKGKTNIMTYAA